MSNTRKASAGSPMRQERFASSPEFQRGLMANLVARRCELLDKPEDRELVWFIQYLSHQEGGLKAVGSALRERFANRIGTASMRQLGCRPGQIYDAEKVRMVRDEFPPAERYRFILKGEYDFLDVISAKGPYDDEPEDRLIREDEINADFAQRLREDRDFGPQAQSHPNKYPAQAFYDICRADFLNCDMESLLKELCLNPEVPLTGAWPWWFSEFANCLREYKADWQATRASETVTTAIGAKVKEAINYAMETGCLVLIDGNARIGKTVSAKALCHENPGRLRYVQTASTNDDIGFLRAIAKSIGVSINLNSKAQELRQRIEETLQPGHLGIVFDEAHYLWPNLIDPRTVPARLNWILTALVNYGVPVALVTTPQFLKAQKLVESRTRWTSEQFTGRLGHYEPLPDSLSEDDLEKVAKALLPEGDATSIKILIRYAQSSSKYLAGIEHAVKRARFLAGRDNRDKVVRQDIKRAIEESVIPSDSAFARAMEPQTKSPRRRSVKGSLMAPLAPINDRTKPVENDLLGTRSSEAPEHIRLDARRESAPPVPG